MERKKNMLVNFYGSMIPCINENNRIFVAVKNICDSIGLDSDRQIKNITEDEVLGAERCEHTVQVGAERAVQTVQVDGMQGRKMIFLPLEFVNGWLFKIKLTNTMSDETKLALLKYKRECYSVLFNYFHNALQKQLQANEIEIKILEELNNLISQKNQLASEIRDKKSYLEKIRKARLNGEPTLF